MRRGRGYLRVDYLRDIAGGVQKAKKRNRKGGTIG